MARDSFSSVASHLKLALITKMKFVFKLCKWRFSENIRRTHVGRRSRSFNGGGRRGLCGCLEDDVKSSSMIRRLQRTRSSAHANSKYDYDDYYYDYDYDDVDRRAEIFINNFRSRLLLEREVSLKLRYCERE